MGIATEETQREVLAAVTTPAAPSGSATAAKQDTGNTSLASIDGKLPALVGGRVPVVVGAALPAGTATIGAVTGPLAAPLALDATLTGGTAKAKVTDQLCTLAGVGQKTSDASAAVVSGVSGGGYLTILNTHASDGAYLGTGTVDNTKFLLSAGASVTWPVADVTTVHCFGTGAVLSWAFLQVA